VLKQLTKSELATLFGQYKSSNKFLVQKKGQDTLLTLTCAEYEAFFGIKYLMSPFFESQELLEELIKNCPWLLNNTFIGEEHRSLGASLRSQLFSGFVADTSIRWISDYIGYGLFAEKPIAKMSYIGQYTGIVRKVGRFSYERNDYCMHIPTRFFSFRYFLMDALKMGGELRFANHSNQPTMKPYCLIDRSLVHIGFFALRDILPGEELTFNYGKGG